MSRALFFFVVVFLANAAFANPNLDFVPKTIEGDKRLGSHAQPAIPFGEKYLADVPLLISDSGFSLWIRHGSTGDIRPLAANAETGVVSLSGKAIEESDPNQKALLKSLAWFLIQRYPEKDFTTAFLKRYFDTSLLQEARPNGLLRRSVLVQSNSGPTKKQLEAFFEDPTQWHDGVCLSPGKCTIAHEPTEGEEDLGSFVASAGIKKLMVHEDELVDHPNAKPRLAPAGGGEMKLVSSQNEFESDFEEAKEDEALVLFTADDCGACQTLHNELETGSKRPPEGTKLYVVSLNSYEWDSMPSDLRRFKAQPGFPQLIRFRKSRLGGFLREAFSPGDSSFLRR